MTPMIRANGRVAGSCGRVRQAGCVCQSAGEEAQLHPPRPIDVRMSIFRYTHVISSIYQTLQGTA